MFTFEEHVEDLQSHIRMVQDAASDLAYRIADQGHKDFARVLLANASVHDASKWHGIEWNYLHVGPDVDKSMLAEAISQHQKANEHHPEYWGGLRHMPKIFVAEMVCDWRARSMELGSDLRDWIKDCATEKYRFDECPEQSSWIKFYVDLLLPKKFA